MYSLFLLAPFVWLVNGSLYRLEYVTRHYLGYRDMVTGYNKQNSIEWPHALFFSPLCLSSRRRVVERDCFTTSNHLIVRQFVCSYNMSQPNKRRRFLQYSEIAELFLDSDSGETSVSSDASTVEGGNEGVPGVSHTQPYRQTASSPKSSSSVSSSASDEDDAVESGPGEQTQQAVTLQWTRPSCPQSSVAHTYTGGPRGKKDNEASHINDGSSPLNV